MRIQAVVVAAALPIIIACDPPLKQGGPEATPMPTASVKYDRTVTTPAPASEGLNAVRRDTTTTDTTSTRPQTMPPGAMLWQPAETQVALVRIHAGYERPGEWTQREKPGGAKKPLIAVESRSIGSGPTLAGLDVLKREGFSRLKGKKVALLTNHSAIDRDGNHVLDLLMAAPGVELVKLFSPEHGLYGNVDTQTGDLKDTATGLMVHSLYSSKPPNPKKPHSPDPKDLKGLDIVVVDMQDIGARYYTYPAYMAYMMEECAPLGIEVMVLDRPNPIGGTYVDGPLTDDDILGKPTAYFKMPIAHGMTMGELARMFNAENRIGSKLTVVACENLTRGMYFDQTGLLWVDPSPNIQDLDAALVYPGVAIPESVVSMGRGTSEPFHVFGAPYIENPREMVDAITSGGLAGVRLEVADFTPTGTLSKGHVGEGLLCQGARMTITDRQAFRPVEMGVRMMAYLNDKYGSVMVPEREWSRAAKRSVPTGRIVPRFDAMRFRGAGGAILSARLREGRPVRDTMEFIDSQVAKFMPVRAKYLIYPKEGR